jgi:glutamate dehydrogenase/leucine dehydrogenase
LHAARLKAKLVPEGTNIPAAADAEDLLHSRGILVLPDFIANAGGVICAAVEYRGGTEAAAIAERISRNTSQVLEQVPRTGKLPPTAAVTLAESRWQTRGVPSPGIL